jgi:hypothetical protein
LERAVRVDGVWAELVTTALLGTDRRDPPELDGPLAELVDDTVRSDPSSRMLAAVAACATVRRAAVLPGPPADRLMAPEHDPRPECSPAAVERWRHVSVSWPVLEDEWMVALIDNGWRLASELIPRLLHRHRRDPVRRGRVLIAAGPLAGWLVGHAPDLEGVRPAIGPLGEGAGPTPLPELPIPADLLALLDAPGSDVGGTIAVGLESGALGASHRAVLVNVLARCRVDALADVAEILEAVDSRVPGHGLAAMLGDLALTRRRMLDELERRT